MQTLTDAIFLSALLVPPVVLVLCAGVTIGSSFVYWLTHATARGAAERQPLALDHPVGR